MRLVIEASRREDEYIAAQNCVENMAYANGRN